MIPPSQHGFQVMAAIYEFYHKKGSKKSICKNIDNLSLPCLFSRCLFLLVYSLKLTFNRSGCQTLNDVFLQEQIHYQQREYYQ